MRQPILLKGASQLTYEIRGIVKKARELSQLGVEIIWENIGDPIQKKHQVPLWIRETIAKLAMDSSTYGYAESQGEYTTRQFLSEVNNARKGAKITPKDILFFNGLGDAISKLYQFLTPTARVIGPSPAYSTHSSAEASHAGSPPLTYTLDPKRGWNPDMEDLELKLKYNTAIVGILVINPDNPTGMVYSKNVLLEIVRLAKKYNVFLVFDEVYGNICYNGSKTTWLSEIIDDVPGIALKGISKEMPWPGARCGWMEFYNRHVNSEFNELCATLENAKMLEVCATKLPQIAIPIIMSDPRYKTHLLEQAQKIQSNSKLVEQYLGSCKHIEFNTTNGSFFNTIIFKEGVLKESANINIMDKKIEKLVQQWCYLNMRLDQKFVYYLMASTGICVVPISSFCSKLAGFRITLLEENTDQLIAVLIKIREAIEEFVSVKSVKHQKSTKTQDIKQ